jgi:hypothetical protein
LIAHRHHVVAGQTQHFNSAAADVFDQFYLHSGDVAERDRQDALTRHFCAVGNRRHDVLVCQLG